MHKKAVFLDRDGTVIVDTEFSVDLAKLCPLPGTMEGLRKLQAAGYLLVVVTNQSGAARGKFDEAGLVAFHRHMDAWFRERGIAFAGFYYCPHYPDSTLEKYAFACGCRKPEPGMLLRAAKDLGIDLARSWMIGDRDADIGAGQRAGCHTFRIGESAEGDPDADYAAEDLDGAAEIILAEGH